jgi:hypothetical protein
MKRALPMLPIAILMVMGFAYRDQPVSAGTVYVMTAMILMAIDRAARR